MRVCILNDNFYRGSGITLVIQRLAQTESFKALDLYLVSCASVKGHEAAIENTSIVPQEHLRTFHLMSNGPELIAALVHFARWLRDLNFDVVHCHHRRLAVLVSALQPFTRVPVLFTGHLTFASAAWFRWGAPAVTTGVSQSVVSYLKTCTRAKQVHLIHNPHEFPHELGPSRPIRHRAASVGRLEPVKALANLIRAWALLKQDGVNAELDIFGEGPLRHSLELLIKDLGLEETVRLRGYVPDLAERLATYSFHVLVSEREGFPNAVIEAAAHGVPSLLTDVDGSRDTLPPSLALPNALPFGDVQALSRALHRWFSDPMTVEEDGVRFFRYLGHLCDPEQIGARYVQLYKQMAKTG